MLCFYDNEAVVLTYGDPGTFYPSISNETGGQQTGLNMGQYACGVAGMHAIDGEVNEDHTGKIIRVYTYAHNNQWYVFADFRSEDQHEMWDIDLICIHQSVVDIQMSQWSGAWVER
jgi:hypothetical protein